MFAMLSRVPSIRLATAASLLFAAIASAKELVFAKSHSSDQAVVCSKDLHQFLHFATKPVVTKNLQPKPVGLEGASFCSTFTLKSDAEKSILSILSEAGVQVEGYHSEL